MTSGPALRDEAMAQLDFAAAWRLGDDWLERAQGVLEDLARRQVPFTAEDLREIVGDPLRPSQMPLLFRRAARAGLIERIGARPADRPERRAGLVSEWLGVADDAA